MNSNYIDHNGRIHPQFGVRSYPQVYVEEILDESEEAEPPQKRQRVDSIAIEENPQLNLFELDQLELLDPIDSVSVQDVDNSMELKNQPDWSELLQELWDQICGYNLKGLEPRPFWTEAKNLLILCKKTHTAVFKFLPTTKLNELASIYRESTFHVWGARRDHFNRFLPIFGNYMSKLSFDHRATGLREDLINLTGLVSLELAKETLSSVENLLNNMRSKEKLQTLSFSANNPNQPVFSRLIQKLTDSTQFPSLTDLTIENHDLGALEEIIKEKDSKGELSRFKSLCFNTNKLHNKITFLTKHNFFSDLRELSLINNGIGPDEVTALTKGTLKSLRSLNLSNIEWLNKPHHNKITVVGFRALAESSNSLCLVKLTIRENNMSDGEFPFNPRSLNPIIGFQNLNYLDLTQNKINDDFLIFFSNVIMPALNTLILDRNKLIKRSGMAIISQMTNMPNLTRLNLASTGCSPRNIIPFRSTQNFRQLSHLDISGNSLDISDGEELLNSGNFPQLTADTIFI